MRVSDQIIILCTGITFNAICNMSYKIMTLIRPFYSCFNVSSVCFNEITLRFNEINMWFVGSLRVLMRSLCVLMR